MPLKSSHSLYGEPNCSLWDRTKEMYPNSAIDLGISGQWLNSEDRTIVKIAGCDRLIPNFLFQIRLRVALIDGPNFLRLSDLSRNTIIGSGFQVEGDPGHYVYDRFDELPAATYYWFLGQEFRGDMVSFSKLKFAF